MKNPVLTNPITKKTFERTEDYVESLISEYQKIKIEMYQAREDEQVLIDALDEVAGSPEIQKGTITVLGVENQAKLVRRVNVRYVKDRGKEHPLKKLLETYPQLEGKVNIKYEEKGTQIQKLVDAYREGKGLSEDVQLVEQVISVREESSGKPVVTIGEKK